MGELECVKERAWRRRKEERERGGERCRERAAEDEMTGGGADRGPGEQSSDGTHSHSPLRRHRPRQANNAQLVPQHCGDRKEMAGVLTFSFCVTSYICLKF